MVDITKWSDPPTFNGWDFGEECNRMVDGWARKFFSEVLQDGFEHNPAEVCFLPNNEELDAGIIQFTCFIPCGSPDTDDGFIFGEVSLNQLLEDHINSDLRNDNPSGRVAPWAKVQAEKISAILRAYADKIETASRAGWPQ